MTLHIFNPEHDIALASGLANFTAPHAGRQLRHDLGFLPALWAAEGDIVMVDDTEQAEREYHKLRHRLDTLLRAGSLLRANCQFAPSKLGVYSEQTLGIQPWGWNSALRAVLIRQGINERLLPSPLHLQTIRELSHRRVGAALLPLLHAEGTVGESFECRQPDEVERLLQHYGQLVMKAPWSSSGRGLRFLSVDRTPFAMQAGWFRNVVAGQGSVMVEPFYKKVKDFGMEFFCHEDGRVECLGLSLFHTENGAYTGNILATESKKHEIINSFMPTDLLNNTQAKLCSLLSNILTPANYVGPLGVDMMIVSADNGFRLHPCVEINLRRTMGHVALALAPTDDDIMLTMRIVYNNNTYHLQVQSLWQKTR